MKALVACVVALLLITTAASAEVVRIEILERDNVGKYERLIGRVYFAIDPANPANRAIADLRLAPANASGLVEFSSDVMFLRPRTSDRSLGTVFVEVVNRGNDQSLGLMSGAVGRPNVSPADWDLGDRFVLEQGFTLAFLGWQFDVPPAQGLGLRAPVAPVRGTVRTNYVHARASAGNTAFALTYCAADPAQASATLTIRTQIDGVAQAVPRQGWRFAPDGCAVGLQSAVAGGLYEVVYEASGSPVAGLGLAAVRDFVSYLKYGGAGATLRERPDLLQRVIGFGYSQSGRFLRELVRDGFNRDEQGRAAFDGLLIASAGAGGGSFNHRFAMPGQAGNSVLSILRPVDLPPFADDGLLARAHADGSAPRIFYTSSSTEYWARAASLTHTNEDGTADAPLAPTARHYLLSGTAHAGGPLPALRLAQYRHDLNFAEQRWVLRALLVGLNAWIRSGVEPPPSRVPTIAGGQLVPRARVRFPALPALPFPAYMPRVWRVDYGSRYAADRIITNEPPTLGAPYAVLVPQVDADGNDEGGVRLPEVAVPLGTFTGWNRTVMPLHDLDYLAGLAGSFDPLARTRSDRERSGDPRPSIAERYKGRSDFLARVTRAIDDLIRERFLLAADRAAVLQRARDTWTAIVERE
jgi:hypothetical protein